MPENLRIFSPGAKPARRHSASPVSYTHLDVYKRQKQESLNDAEAENRYPELGGVTKRLAADLNKLKEKILIFENGLDDRAVELTKLAMSKAVSYTHLDVYKRQSLGWMALSK